MRYDIYSEFHGKIPIEKIVPKLIPLWKEDKKVKEITRVDAHQRAKRLLQFDLLEQKVKAIERPLPPSYDSIMEISCRAHSCPYPFNLDPWESGVCFNCIYCFAIHFKSSLYTSFYDDFTWKPRPTSFEHLKKTLTEILNARGVQSSEREKGKGDSYCGSITNVRPLKKAAKQRIPLRIGNKSENFLPIEKKVGITLEALKIIKDFDYPLIINTKSTLVAEEPYISILGDLSKVVVQISIIHNDDEVAKKIEPLAPPSSERWRVMKELNEVGITAIPRLEPIMAFINDDDEHLREYARSAAEAEAKYALMDAYSYTTRSPKIAELFEANGFDFDRMFEATSEYQILGSYLIQKASYYLKKEGIKTSTFDFPTIPYNDTQTCCAIDPVFGNWYKYNMYSMIDLLIDKKELSFKEFDEKYAYGLELTASIRNYLKRVWLGKVQTPWHPLYVEGVYVKEVLDDDIIYGFNPKELGKEYRRIMEVIN